MSLWSIPDEATAGLMSDFYHNLNGRRALPPVEALRRAQLGALHRNRTENADGRPSEWAAFVASGDRS